MSAKIQQSIQHYIGGVFCNGDPLGSTQKQYNRWDGTYIGALVHASNKQLEEAAMHAQQAFAQSTMSTFEERHHVLRCFREGLALRYEDLVQTLCQEAGKTRAYAEVEVQRALFTLESAEALCLLGPDSESVQLDFGIGRGKKPYVERFAVGPVLAFSPYNFPLNLAIHKIAPALVAGAPVVLKPSPYTPKTAHILAQIWDSCNTTLPKSMFQVVHCSNEQAQAWVTHPAFKVLSFTGSARVGWHLKSLVPRKKVLLELGGNAWLVVDSVGPKVKALADLCVRSAFTYSGQVCVALQNLFVREEEAEVLKAALITSIQEQYKQLVSPMISEEALQRFQAQVLSAEQHGAQVLFCQKPLVSDPAHMPPFYLLGGLNTSHPIVSEEAFAPQLNIHVYSDIDHVFDQINQGRFGLQAALFSDSLSTIKKAYRVLDVGALIVNDAPGFRVDTMPYGGVKDSGIGREGVAFAYREITEPKLLVW